MHSTHAAPQHAAGSLAATARASACSAIRSSVVNVHVATTSELGALGGPKLAKGPCRASCPDPARLDDGPGLDPRSCRDAAAGLYDYTVCDAGHDSDEAIVA